MKQPPPDALTTQNPQLPTNTFNTSSTPTTTYRPTIIKKPNTSTTQLKLKSTPPKPKTTTSYWTAFSHVFSNFYSAMPSWCPCKRRHKSNSKPTRNSKIHNLNEQSNDLHISPSISANVEIIRFSPTTSKSIMASQMALPNFVHHVDSPNPPLQSDQFYSTSTKKQRSSSSSSLSSQFDNNFNINTTSDEIELEPLFELVSSSLSSTLLQPSQPKSSSTTPKSTAAKPTTTNFPPPSPHRAKINFTQLLFNSQPHNHNHNQQSQKKQRNQHPSASSQPHSKSEKQEKEKEFQFLSNFTTFKSITTPLPPMPPQDIFLRQQYVHAILHQLSSTPHLDIISFLIPSLISLIQQHPSKVEQLFSPHDLHQFNTRIKPLTQFTTTQLTILKPTQQLQEFATILTDYCILCNDLDPTHRTFQSSFLSQIRTHSTVQFNFDDLPSFPLDEPQPQLTQKQLAKQRDELSSQYSKIFKHRDNNLSHFKQLFLSTSKTRRIPMGLQNCGATCFFNGTIQQLFSSTQFSTLFLLLQLEILISFFNDWYSYLNLQYHYHLSTKDTKLALHFKSYLDKIIDFPCQIHPSQLLLSYIQSLYLTSLSPSNIQPPLSGLNTTSPRFIPNPNFPEQSLVPLNIRFKENFSSFLPSKSIQPSNPFGTNNDDQLNFAPTCHAAQLTSTPRQTPKFQPVNTSPSQTLSSLNNTTHNNHTITSQSASFQYLRPNLNIFSFFKNELFEPISVSQQMDANELYLQIFNRLHEEINTLFLPFQHPISTILAQVNLTTTSSNLSSEMQRPEGYFDVISSLSPLELQLIQSSTLTNPLVNPNFSLPLLPSSSSSPSSGTMINPPQFPHFHRILALQYHNLQLFVSTFSFSQQSTITCSQCHSVRSKTEAQQWALNLTIPQEAQDILELRKQRHHAAHSVATTLPLPQPSTNSLLSLDQCLQATFSEEYLPDVFCSSCPGANPKVPASKRMSLDPTVFPSVLSLYLPRFIPVSQNISSRQTFSYFKDTRYISFPFSIFPDRAFSHFFSQQNCGNSLGRWILESVLVHSGSPTNGHYYCFRTNHSILRAQTIRHDLAAQIQHNKLTLELNVMEKSLALEISPTSPSVSFRSTGSSPLLSLIEPIQESDIYWYCCDDMNVQLVEPEQNHTHDSPYTCYSCTNYILAKVVGANETMGNNYLTSSSYSLDESLQQRSQLESSSVTNQETLPCAVMLSYSYFPTP